MNPIHRDLFQAIHEGKWLTIEYQNKKDQKTRYWIGIRELNPVRRASRESSSQRRCGTSL